MTITQIFKTACLGSLDAVKDLQSSTGIKDTIANFWTDQLLEMAKTRHREVLLAKSPKQDPRLRGLRNEDREDMKNQIKKEIQQELMDWVVQQPSEPYSLLAEDDRTCF